VCFDGVIELTDPEVFKEVYVKGIGRAKAFGCGMLSLARAL
jgi:CRISPR associated protein.